MSRGRRRRGFIALALFLMAVIASFRASHWLTAHGLTAMDYANELQRDEPRFQWKSIDKKHWQAVAVGVKGPEETATQKDARERTSDGCSVGMVRVTGAFRQEAKGQSTGAIERLQDGACTDWISKEFPARCRIFDRAKIATDIASTPTTPLDFCIDRFEHPNVFGQNPIIVSTFHEAEAMCKQNAKRLCNENEWTFACEGEEARPYPYGWTRDETACVIDRPWRAFTEGALQPRDSDKARDELDHLWQGEPSGSRPTCRSTFGVYDLTGNVDEWTRSVNPTGFRSILKGGYWGPVRARCRPSTRAHNEDFIAYQQSFRCCSEANADAGAEPEALDADASTPEDSGTNPPDASDDEIVAIEHTRSRGCAMAGGSRNGHGFALLALTLFLARRRRSKAR